ncbi:hypothetical protein E3N88_29423 [Mikania micrantha]|uniref:CCHC-type domain-containing protein n=1 Tax=Mikania micrantha TaxID=192012 RepID=A0A5N6MJ02_9ASTR|nr:hypothetical protein E3N88_29423 [Mikania micrantha]
MHQPPRFVVSISISISLMHQLPGKVGSRAELTIIFGSCLDLLGQHSIERVGTRGAVSKQSMRSSSIILGRRNGRHSGSRGRSQKSVKCWNYKEVGHVKSQCPRKQWNSWVMDFVASIHATHSNLMNLRLVNGEFLNVTGIGDVMAKRTNVPGMKQYRGRRFNPYMGYRGFRRPYVPPYFYSPYGYGLASHTSFN